jgi:lipopolysaccharide biosynthesis regulator YciM
MDTYWLVLIPIALVATLTFFALYRRRTNPRQVTAMEAYVDGLRLLTAGDEQSAFVKFRQAVDEDTYNIDAYLKMGDIFRNRGMADKALQIHRGLRLRQGVHPEVQLEIDKSLALDYLRVGSPEKAYEILEKLLKDGSSRNWAAEKLLGLYTRDRRWKDASDVYESIIQKGTRGDGSATLAGLKLMVGRDLHDDGEFHKARVTYKEALSVDKTNPLPYLYIAESYIEEKRPEEGLEFLKRLCQETPRYAHLGFPIIEDTLFRLGRFGEIEDIYRSILASDPANAQAKIALAGIHEKKGEMTSAENLLKSVLDLDPANPIAALRLVTIMAGGHRLGEALCILSDLAEKIKLRSQELRCQKCGKGLSRPLPACPHCGTVGNII